MSEVKVNKISPRTNCGTVTLGDSGDTFTIPSGATITNSGTASGFGATGEVSWDTTVKTTGTFTATAGVGYFCNTSGGIITVNLPAGAAGSSVALVDYAGTWQNNKVTVSPNGAEKMGGVAAGVDLDTEGQSVTFVYIDGTQGWVNVLDSTSNVRGGTYIVATVSGSCNTLTTAPDCANVKIAKFVNPGTFCVSSIASCTAQNTVGYMVVAGGGGGGKDRAGGGGAGGYREGRNVPVDNFTASPLVADAPTNAVTITASAFPITIGGGGAGGNTSPTNVNGTNGTNSIFSTITATGGGGGHTSNRSPMDGNPGGSGGGGAGSVSGTGGNGNSPPFSPAQGQNGGTAQDGPNSRGAGGGGAGAAAANASTSPTSATPGGAGVSTSISGGCVAYAGGGGATGNPPITTAPGGTGGGGAGGNPAGTAGTVNTGGGGGGSQGATGATGGSGIVYIRYKFQ